MCEGNGIETIVAYDEILCLNEKHIEEELGRKHFREITIKYHSVHRKHKYELVHEPKNNQKEFL